MARGIARLLAGLMVCFGVFAAAAPAGAATPDVTFTAVLNGRNLSTISSNDPLHLSSAKPLVVSLSVTNNTGRAITVSASRIRGRVMGLSFFSYDTQIALKVPAGSTQKTSFSVGLADLAGQATGLLPTSIALLDDNSAALASKDFSVDVDGDATSIYGVFGLAVAALTVLWLVSLIYRVARRSLPGNRWSRAVQFAVAGFGVGLTLTFTVSALSLLTPDAGVWAPFVFGAGAVGFAIGYLTPGPRVVDPDEEDQFIASRAPAYAVGASAPAPALDPGSQPELAAAQQPGLAAGQQPGLEARPWQGEIERTPFAHQPVDDGDTTPRGLLETPAPPADATTQQVPRYAESPSPGIDDRETTEVDRTDFDAFFRKDDRRPDGQ